MTERTKLVTSSDEPDDALPPVVQATFAYHHKHGASAGSTVVVAVRVVVTNALADRLDSLTDEAEQTGQKPGILPIL